jgi:large subunit ribosomal protein L22
MATTAPEKKTNERPGVRAQVRYVRCSAYKAREVLDLIRGKHVSQALEILEFSERSISQIILKCLESAIANAMHNNEIPDDELYVSACYADEGPTLKRWRPRARGRATRIRKRTCHITIIVSRMEAGELERLRDRESTAGRGNVAAAEARRRRVLRSRSEKAEKKAAERAAHDHDHDHDHDDEHDHDEDVTDEDVTDEGAAGSDEIVDAEAIAEEGIVDQDAAGVEKAAEEAAEPEKTPDAAEAEDKDES